MIVKFDLVPQLLNVLNITLASVSEIQPQGSNDLLDICSRLSNALVSTALDVSTLSPSLRCIALQCIMKNWSTLRIDSDSSSAIISMIVKEALSDTAAEDEEKSLFRAIFGESVLILYPSIEQRLGGILAFMRTDSQQSQNGGKISFALGCIWKQVLASADIDVAVSSESLSKILVSLATFAASLLAKSIQTDDAVSDSLGV